MSLLMQRSSAVFPQMQPELDQNLTLFWSQVLPADMINGLMKTQWMGNGVGRWVGMGYSCVQCHFPKTACLLSVCICASVWETFVSDFHWCSDEAQQGERASNEREGVGPRTLQYSLGDRSCRSHRVKNFLRDILETSLHYLFISVEPHTSREAQYAHNYSSVSSNHMCMNLLS